MMITRRVILISFVILSVLPLLNGIAYESDTENMLVLSREKRKVVFFPQYTTLQVGDIERQLQF
jgi:hypothetical protein